MSSNYSETLGPNVAENYERYFVPAIGRPVAEELIRTAALKPGERVLDIGCGTGIVTRLAAEQAGPGTRVAGLDPNPGMLAIARRTIPAAISAEWYEAGAEAMPFSDDEFDVALSQMSLQFVPDKAAALREVRRVLASGGRLVLNVPGPTAPLFDIFADAMGRHIAPETAGFVRQVFSLHDVDEVRGMLDGAGFDEVEVEASENDLVLPGPREFLWQYIYSTPLLAPVKDAGETARGALESEVLAGWRDFEVDGGLKLRQRMVTASAVKP